MGNLEAWFRVAGDVGSMQRLIEGLLGEFLMNLTTAYLEVASWGVPDLPERVVISITYMTLEPRMNNNNCCRCRRLSESE